VSTRTRLKVEEIVPSAARTVASLRDIGYTVPRAVADLIDNSIAARATRVEVTLHFEGGDSWISVADNGIGMDGATLQEAMRYGTDREYSTDDLGKFGFGLKTASTSQCRRLTVASRHSTQRARLEVRSLDIEHIERTGRWEILVLEGGDRPDVVTGQLRSHTGTVVLWEEMDRVLEYKDPWGEWAKKKLFALAEEIDLHLGMVFHRFLNNEVPRHRLVITVNGSRVEPWDPFCRSEPKTEAIPAKDLPIAGDEGMGIVRVSAYILPPQGEFSSAAAWARASGPDKWNRQQGFYVYRANRLIQSGGWNRMRTSDEHHKLARVALDFFPSLDSAFGINIAKAYVRLPHELREQVDPIVSQVTRRAGERYRKAEPRGTGGGSGGGTAAGRRGTGPGRGSRWDGESGRPPPATRVRSRRALEEAAGATGETKALARIVGALRKRHPEVARDLGW